MSKEARARIKINELLKEAGWRFFDDVNCRANIVLENNVKITEHYMNELGGILRRAGTVLLISCFWTTRGSPPFMSPALSTGAPGRRQPGVD